MEDKSINTRINFEFKGLRLTTSSFQTVHRYMNHALKCYSIIHGIPYEFIFRNNKTVSVFDINGVNVGNGFWSLHASLVIITYVFTEPERLIKSGFYFSSSFLTKNIK